MNRTKPAAGHQRQATRHVARLEHRGRDLHRRHRGRGAGRLIVDRRRRLNAMGVALVRFRFGAALGGGEAEATRAARRRANAAG